MKRKLIYLAAAAAVLMPKAPAPAQQATPKPERPKLSWTTDLAKMKVPNAPVSGTIHGRDFVMDQAKLDGGTLTIRRGEGFWPEAAVVISLFLEEGETVAGKTYRATGAKRFGDPFVRMQWASGPDRMPDSEDFMGKNAMILEFGRTKGGQLPGKLYLCVPDESKSVVAGTFSVEVFDATHPLVTNTLISGEVAVKKGAGEVRMSLYCIGKNQEGEVEYPSATLDLKEGATSWVAGYRPRETRLTWDKTRRTVRHEHTNRPPGWYLLYLRGHRRRQAEGDVGRISYEGSYDWKWVELKDKNSKVIANLTVDPAALGDVEISAPGAAQKSAVMYLPLDPEGRFPWPEVHWYLHGTNGVEVRDGKAVVRWLREGRYQFTLIDARKSPAPLATIEANVTRGKTTKIELVPMEMQHDSRRAIREEAEVAPVSRLCADRCSCCRNGRPMVVRASKAGG